MKRTVLTLIFACIAFFAYCGSVKPPPKQEKSTAHFEVKTHFSAPIAALMANDLDTAVFKPFTNQIPNYIFRKKPKAVKVPLPRKSGNYKRGLSNFLAKKITPIYSDAERKVGWQKRISLVLC